MVVIVVASKSIVGRATPVVRGRNRIDPLLGVVVFIVPILFFVALFGVKLLDLGVDDLMDEFFIFRVGVVGFGLLSSCLSPIERVDEAFKKLCNASSADLALIFFIFFVLGEGETSAVVSFSLVWLFSGDFSSLA